MGFGENIWIKIIIISVLYFFATGRKRNLNLFPKDIYVTDFTLLEANCTIGKEIAQRRDINASFLRFRIDEKEVSQDLVTIPKWNIATVKFYVNSTEYHRAILKCYLPMDTNLSSVAYILIGNYPYNVTKASCTVMHWKDLVCKFTKSGTNKHFRTDYNMELSSSSEKLNRTQTLPDDKTVTTFHNLYEESLINETFKIRISGHNRLGQGPTSTFSFEMKDLIVVPNVEDLKVVNNFNASKIALKFTSPKADENFLVVVDVTCDQTPYTFEVATERNIKTNDLIVEINEKDLPPFKNCSASLKLKPLYYGLFSNSDNQVAFQTRTRVPLKNPEVFNSSFSIRECNKLMECNVDIYFKDLSDEESGGFITEYRVTLDAIDTKLQKQFLLPKIVHFQNKGLPYVTMEKLQMTSDVDAYFLFGLEAGTSAGYNSTAAVSFIWMNACYVNYKSLFSLDWSDESYYKPVESFVPFVIVSLDEKRADVVSLLDLNFYNVIFVWCLYDQTAETCTEKFGWSKLEGKNETAYNFTVSGSHVLDDYEFGIQYERLQGQKMGIQWMESRCFFISSARTIKPEIMDYKVYNDTSLVVKISSPKCSKSETWNFPREYVVKYLSNHDSDQVKIKRFNYLNEQIVLNDILPNHQYKVSVLSLPWLPIGSNSDEYSFSFPNGPEVQRDFYWLTIIVATCVILLGVLAAWALKNKRLNLNLLKKITYLEISVPSASHKDGFDQVNSYSNPKLHQNSSGYTIISEHMELGSGRSESKGETHLASSQITDLDWSRSLSGRGDDSMEHIYATGAILSSTPAPLLCSTGSYGSYNKMQNDDRDVEDMATFESGGDCSSSSGYAGAKFNSHPAFTLKLLLEPPCPIRTNVKYFSQNGQEDSVDSASSDVTTDSVVPSESSLPDYPQVKVVRTDQQTSEPVNISDVIFYEVDSSSHSSSNYSLAQKGQVTREETSLNISLDTLSKNETYGKLGNASEGQESFETKSTEAVDRSNEDDGYCKKSELTLLPLVVCN